MRGHIISKLDNEEILEYISNWEAEPANKKYAHYFNALINTFSRTNPQNKSLDDVIIKVAALDNLFSTNVIHKDVVADKIISINHFDDRVREGCLALVDELKSMQFGENSRQLYSFASKYCHFHNVRVYPIYGRHVDSTLRFYSKGYESIGYSRKLIKDYGIFNQLIQEFRDEFGLMGLSVRELDKFLWIYGKEMDADKKRL